MICIHIYIYHTGAFCYDIYVYIYIIQGHSAMIYIYIIQGHSVMIYMYIYQSDNHACNCVIGSSHTYSTVNQTIIHVVVSLGALTLTLLSIRQLSLKLCHWELSYLLYCQSDNYPCNFVIGSSRTYSTVNQTIIPVVVSLGALTLTLLSIRQLYL